MWACDIWATEDNVMVSPPRKEEEEEKSNIINGFVCVPLVAHRFVFVFVIFAVVVELMLILWFCEVFRVNTKITKYTNTEIVYEVESVSLCAIRWQNDFEYFDYVYVCSPLTLLVAPVALKPSSSLNSLVCTVNHVAPRRLHTHTHPRMIFIQSLHRKLRLFWVFFCMHVRLPSNLWSERADNWCSDNHTVQCAVIVYWRKRHHARWHEILFFPLSFFFVLRPFSDRQVRRVRNHLVHGQTTATMETTDRTVHTVHTHTHRNERQPVQYVRIEIFFGGMRSMVAGGAARFRTCALCIYPF